MLRMVVACASLAVGCSAKDSKEPLAPLSIPEGCNPIAHMPGIDGDCLLPFPSDFYRKDAARVAIPQRAGLVDKKGNAIDLLALHPPNGYSPGAQILALFPEGIDDSNLVGASADLTASLADGSATVIVDEQGKRILHLAELDPRVDDDTRRALLIRPLVRLKDGARYVVAIRGLRGKNGALLAPREGFRRVRDGQASGDSVLAPLTARYHADVFAPLEKAGVAKADLQLAWDFTVRSRDDVTRDMVAVRKQTIAFFAGNMPKLAVVEQKDDPDKHTARRLELTIEVPMFLANTEPMAKLHRDANGAIAQNGTTKVPFTVWLPKSVAARPANGPPARLMQFGHGFFGQRSEVEDFINQLADERGFVVVAADWWGMSASDKTPIADALASNMNGALAFTDRVHQAVANLIAIALAAPSLAALPELALGPKPLFSGSPYFYGISMGHILGGTYFAMSPTIERAVLGVGGADWSLMMFRARPFVAFLAFVALAVPDKLDQQKFAALAQSELDRIDPLVYAPLIGEPLDGAPKQRRVLMQIGIGDAAVPNLASHLHARALGLSLLTPSPRAIALLPTATAPFDGSAMVEFDFGIKPLPDAKAIPPVDDTKAHEAVRRLAAAKEQLDRFLRPDGKIEATCQGPCDPE
jgi:hypothetical protein